MCGLAACETGNGTYFVVDGDRAGIAFDQVEFFLGKDTSGPKLFTPARPYSSPNPADLERQRLIKRLFSPSDIQTTAETRSLTYYLPPDDENTLAHYALVVASRGGQVVGLGEIEDFSVFDDARYLYDVALAPVDAGYERWGHPDSIEKACVRWTRRRAGDTTSSTYAVVRGDDLDCDGAQAGKECDDLNYCAGAIGEVCKRRITACINPLGCDLGICLDPTPGTAAVPTCEPTTCLPDLLCAPGDDCREEGPVEDFLECAVTRDNTMHTEVTMPIMDGGALCRHQYQVVTPNRLPCQNPEIEWPLLGLVDDGWMIAVSTSGSSIDGCMYTLTGPTPDARPPEKSHLVVSIELLNGGGKRTSFVIGFAPEPSPTGCLPFAIMTPPETSSPTCP